jgi:hypothetical protein
MRGPMQPMGAKTAPRSIAQDEDETTAKRSFPKKGKKRSKILASKLQF